MEQKEMRKVREKQEGQEMQEAQKGQERQKAGEARGQKQGGNDLGNDPIPKLLFRLAIPTLLAQLVNLLYSVVDRIYVGRIPGAGELALAGLGVTFPITALITAFASLIGAGGGPRAAIAMGRGDHQEAEKILGNCLTMVLGLAVMLSAVFFCSGNRSCAHLAPVTERFPMPFPISKFICWAPCL